jgi:hypothetical protein
MRGSPCGMRSQLAGACALCVLAVGLGCNRGAPADAAAERTAAARPGGDASPLLELDSAALQRAGIQIVDAAPARFEPEALAFGRVLDPAPVIEAVAAREASLSASSAAQRELQRSEQLARDRQNASAREVEASRASAARARADLQVAEARLAALLPPALARESDLTDLSQQLGRHAAVLIRVDVPRSAGLPQPERGAHLVAYPDLAHELEARLLGPVPAVNPALPGWSFLFLVESAPPPVGAPVRARLRMAGDALDGVSVPSSAVIQYAGRFVVFVAHQGSKFERRPVVARAQSEARWFVSEGLTAGEPIVSAGAQQLLSAQILQARGSADAE